MQITLDGKTKEQVVIDLLHQYEPPEGYYLDFSGGKDSVCIYNLVLQSGVKFDAHYSVVGVDPPELVTFIKKNYKDVKFEMPKKSMWRYIQSNGLPTQQHRWCCRALKERGGEGRTVITGIRWEESNNRSNRRQIESSRDGKKKFLHIIIGWTLLDVWDFIDTNHFAYCSLYDTYADRLGCVMCPMDSHRHVAMKRYPKIAEAWHRAALRYYEAQSKGVQRFSSGEDFWLWWLSGKSIKEYSNRNQGVMNI